MMGGDWGFISSPGEWTMQHEKVQKLQGGSGSSSSSEPLTAGWDQGPTVPSCRPPPIPLQATILPAAGSCPPPMQKKPVCGVGGSTPWIKSHDLWGLARGYAVTVCIVPPWFQSY